MRYTIRHFDLPLLTFEANMDSADTGLHFIKVYEENRSFLPLNLTVSEDGVERWLRHRAIPKNRAYVDALLSKVGLSLNRPLGIIAANKGLSLNDCFWVDAEGSGDTFEKVNLYDNRFSQVLAAIAFTGYGSSIRTSLASCPEFSTNGMLPKCWRRQNGKIYLYKSGTSGFSNLGFERYSEMYAYAAFAFGSWAFLFGIGGQIALFANFLGPIGIVAGALISAGLGIMKLFGGGWEKSVAKKLVNAYEEKGVTDQYRKAINEYWAQTETAFDQAAEQLDQAWTAYVERLQTTVDSYDIEQIETSLTAAKGIQNFFEHIPL